MRLLVTGAAGFVGSHLVRAALGRGHEVVAAVRSRARAAPLEGLSTDPRLVEADLTDIEAMRRAAADASPDLALHLAWSIGPDCYDSPENLACVAGSLALLQGLVDAGCPRVLFVGTHLELAPGDRDMDEDAPVAPRDLYATCKPEPTSRARRPRSCGRDSSTSTGRARRTGRSCRTSSSTCSRGGGVR
jgi:dTDP-6-deoxy-L-talose 4-dehydrogenase (NAD+)